MNKRYVLVLYITDDGKDADGNENHFVSTDDVEAIFDNIDLPAGITIESVIFEELK